MKEIIIKVVYTDDVVEYKVETDKMLEIGQILNVACEFGGKCTCKVTQLEPEIFAEVFRIDTLFAHDMAAYSREKLVTFSS